MSNIEWTDETWNPVVGCAPVSPGCLNCYAARMARRLEKMGTWGYEAREPEIGTIAARHQAGVTTPPSISKTIRIAEVKNGRPGFTGDVRCLRDRLTDPMHWRNPRRIFVNSMSDLFFGTEHDRAVCERNGVPFQPVPFEFIDRVFAVTALCPQHTFQVLTKRPERMAEYWSDLPYREDMIGEAAAVFDERFTAAGGWNICLEDSPLRNVWLGTSCERQEEADERIPHLLRCPAKVRFLSCEPLLGPIDLSAFFGGQYVGLPGDVVHPNYNFGIDWVIVGGESGPGARPCNVEWIRSIVRQCKAAGVPCFVKQVGSKPEGFAQWTHPDNEGYGVEIGGESGRRLADRKGGDPTEWPADLQVREFPR